MGVVRSSLCQETIEFQLDSMSGPLLNDNHLAIVKWEQVFLIILSLTQQRKHKVTLVLCNAISCLVSELPLKSCACNAAFREVSLQHNCGVL